MITKESLDGDWSYMQGKDSDWAMKQLANGNIEIGKDDLVTMIQEQVAESKMKVSLCPICNCMTHKICAKCQTTNERIRKIIPYMQDNFITCDTEFDFSFMVNIWLIISEEKSNLPEYVLTNPRIEYAIDPGHGRRNVEVSVYPAYDSAIESNFRYQATIEELLDAAIEIIEYYKEKK